jgi:hypothetical protein
MSDQSDSGQYRILDRREGSFGVALSGGGIRSASFCLGAMRYLRESPLGKEVRHLSTVSGGSWGVLGFFAASFGSTSPSVWRDDSKESRHMRRTAHRMFALGESGLVAALLLMRAMAFTLGCVSLASFLGGSIVGIGFRIPRFDGQRFSAQSRNWSVAILLLFALLVLAVSGAVNYRRRRPSAVDRTPENAFPVFGFSFFALGLGILLIPQINNSAISASERVPLRLFFDGALVDKRISHSAAGIVVLGLTCSAVFGTCFGLTRTKAFAFLTAVSLYCATLFPPFLAGYNFALQRSFRQLGPVLASALLTMILLQVFIDANRVSLHSNLRDRLKHAFVGSEVSDSSKFPAGTSKTPPFRVAYDGPEIPLWVCLTETRARGRARDQQLKTIKFDGDQTWNELIRATALSGGAFNPLVGRGAFAPFRLLMSILNLRLGLWYKDGEEVEIGLPHALILELFPIANRKNHIYNSDGGAVDNLALLPLLEAGCDEILCFDASYTTSDDSPSLLGSFRLAREKLGVEIIRLDDESDTGSTCLSHYLLQTKQGTAIRLTVVSLKLWASAPFDLKQGAKSRRFPMVPTSLQFVDSANFDDLLRLGDAAARHAVENVAPRVLSEYHLGRWIN